MHLRVLAVESDPENLLFLEALLAEIEERRLWHPWVQIETLAASNWREAAAAVSREPVDVILLNPNLSDSTGAVSFRHLQRVAPQIPVIALTEGDDRDLAAHLVREGAQDCLRQKHLDCAPLARAIQNAIERQRLLSAARAGAMLDPLTGLLNQEAFLTFAERDRKLAVSLQLRWLLMLVELRSDLAGGEQSRDLALVEASDCLRSLVGSEGLLGRVSELRFALALFDTPGEPVDKARTNIEAATSVKQLTTGTAILEPAHPVALDTLLEQAEANLPASARASGA